MHIHFLRMKGISQKSTRSKSLGVAMHRVMLHNLREIVAEIGVREGSHINPTKTKENIVLYGGNTSCAVNDELKKLMQGVKVHQWRKDTISAIELVFSLPSDATVNYRGYFTDSMNWCINFFNVPLVSAVIHLDEDAPHCHVILIPIVEGSLCGSKVMGNPKQVKVMHEDFYSKVSKKYGFTRKSLSKRQSAALRREAVEMAFNVLEMNSGLHSGIVRVLVEGHFNNPELLLKVLNLEMPKHEKQSKQIIEPTTIEVETTMPIEVDLENNSEKMSENSTEKNQPLSCVEVERTETIYSMEIEPETELIQDDYLRESETDNLSSQFDTEKGEFIKLAVKVSHKPNIHAIVNKSLRKLSKSITQ